MSQTGAARLCAACGAPAPSPFRSPPAEQAPDLDLRPGEPTRGTLARWVATCRRCGACAPDLAALPPGAAEVVASAPYRDLDRPAPALPFLRWAMLCEAGGQRQEAAEGTLQGAWALDDAGDEAGAAALRREAAALWVAPEDAEGALRLLDVLRRAGAFGDATAHADRVGAWPLDESSARILAFQRERIAAGDAGRYLISSALRPPARTPHVTHGRSRQAAPGFWRRLIGR